MASEKIQLVFMCWFCILKIIRFWWRNWRYQKKKILCSWIGRFNIVKIFALPKTTYRFSTNPNKIPIAFFTEIEKFTWNHKTIAILRKENKVGDNTYLISNIITKPQQAKHCTILYWHKKQTFRPVDQNWESKNKSM